MRVKVSRPAIALTTAMAILLASVAVYALLTAGAARADSTYNPQTNVKFCNDMENPFPPDPFFNGGAGTCSEATGLAGAAHPDITTALTIVKGDLNFSNVVTLAPLSQTICTTAAPCAGGAPDVGEKVGALHSATTLGTFNGPCNLSIGVDFVFFNVALPNNPGSPRASTNITFPQPQGTPDRFSQWSAPGTDTDPGVYTPNTYGSGAAINNADGPNNAFQGYPSYLLDAFDPDFNPLTGAQGPANPLVPIAVYGGISKVVGSAIPLYFVQFASGQLTALTRTPLAKITAPMGQPSVSVLNDPTEAPSTSSISDFCSPLGTTSVILGTGSNGHFTHTNPAANTQQFYLQYNASLRDTDQDGFENTFDTCPLVRNVGDGRAANSPANGDSDSDGIDNACDATANPGITDQDGDGYSNRQDNCPQDSNGAAVTFQRDSEIGNTSAAADNGPSTDSIGDVCDTGTISVNQNNNNNAGSGPAPAPALSITMSTTVGNGRYMTATNLVAKCIGTAANDVDGDGYCISNDGFDSGNCGPLVSDGSTHCAARHNAWAGATHPALQMDTDGDKLFDTQETWMSQCAIGAGSFGSTPVPCAQGGTGSNTSYPATPAPGAVPGYTLGSDAAHSCAQTTTAKDEGPWDNWGYDFNDDGIVTGGDFLAFSAPFGKTVDQGLRDNTGLGSGWTAIYRFDLNNDGIVSGGDFLAIAPVYAKSCGTGAPLNIPAFTQQ